MEGHVGVIFVSVNEMVTETLSVTVYVPLILRHGG